ncbi:MAG: formate dehydrogenase subunit gamma, partial [Betaproteobacteria bacterium]|nr:formate dehydrogenase subunit gamma [Betaproteobacteria bacterium]
QQMNVIHSVSAALFVAMGIAHIYLGTAGVEGAYETMRTGMTDESWAKEHHEYWYNDHKADRGMTGGAPSTAPASPMREGWK